MALAGRLLLGLLLVTHLQDQLPVAGWDTMSREVCQAISKLAAKLGKVMLFGSTPTSVNQASSIPILNKLIARTWWHRTTASQAASLLGNRAVNHLEMARARARAHPRAPHRWTSFYAAR